MRIVLWHGYLLAGTGSNVYTRALAREWARAGHNVVVVSQERDPERYELAGARTVRPELPGGLLPVFVVDAYEGLTPGQAPLGPGQTTIGHVRRSARIQRVSRAFHPTGAHWV